MSANGGIPELVVRTEAEEQIYGPQVLPGGEWVLFTVTRARGLRRWDQAQIVIQSLDSGERKVLVTGGSDAKVRDDWTSGVHGRRCFARTVV